MPLPAWKIGTVKGTCRPSRKGTPEMKLSHTLSAMSVAFDDPNLVSSAGLVPVLALAAPVRPDETAGPR